MISRAGTFSSERELASVPEFAVPDVVPGEYSGPQYAYGHDVTWDPAIYDGHPPTRSPTSTTMVSDTARILPSGFGFGSDAEKASFQTARERRTLCGLKRRWFALVMASSVLLLIGLVVGVVVGLEVVKDHSNEEAAAASPDSGTVPLPTIGATPPSQISAAAAERGEPMAGTSFATVAYAAAAAKNGASANAQPNMRLFFQEAASAVHEIRYDAASAAWRDASSLFSDAKNNSGLASFTHMNGTEQQITLIYVDQNNQLQTKRQSGASSTWQSKPIVLRGPDQRPVRVNGSRTTPDSNGSLKLAAVYSTDFRPGPGARLFYHTAPEDDAASGGGGGGSSWVQELIWDGGSDTWTLGQRIRDAVGTSQLAATVDGRALRVYYCAGNGTLQESWLNMTAASGAPGPAPAAEYQTGFTRPNSLGRDDGPIAALAVPGLATVAVNAATTLVSSSALVYFVDDHAGVRELNVTSTLTTTTTTVTVPSSSRSRSQSVGSAATSVTVTVDSTMALNPSLVAPLDAQSIVSLGCVLAYGGPGPSTSGSGSRSTGTGTDTAPATAHVFFSALTGAKQDGVLRPAIGHLSRALTGAGASPDWALAARPPPPPSPSSSSSSSIFLPLGRAAAAPAAGSAKTG
ncbi:MAG: hypothetical protein M1826_005877 [Phylliscum demangeonii]|nr:MAG: hypothetical protein M1826_005877 [Phylliscum demangeonii]